MLICVGGFAGSGRNRLAADIAHTLGFHFLPIVPTKRAAIFREAHRISRPFEGAPYSDQLLVEVYARILKDFRLVSKMYPNLVIRDYFHREGPREFFFKEAEKYFGRPLVLWADASHEESEQYLREVFATREHKLKARLVFLDQVEQQKQSFTRPVHAVRHIENPVQALEQVRALIREHRV